MSRSHALRSTALVLALASAFPAAAWTLDAQPGINMWPNLRPYSLVIGDVNGDGRDDMVVTTVNYGGQAPWITEVRVYRQGPDGKLRAPLKAMFTGDERASLALADLDGDHSQEIIFGMAGRIAIIDVDQRARDNIRARTYAVLAPALDATQVAVADIDRDGHDDIVAQSWSTGATVFFGDGHGGIVRRGHIATAVDGQNDLKTGDFNGDGYKDVAVVAGSGGIWLHYNDGHDQMAPGVRIGSSFAPVGVGDFNGDGRVDVASLKDSSTTNVWSQLSDGSLGAPVPVATSAQPWVMAGTDIDADGDDDLVVATASGEIVNNAFFGTIDVYQQEAGAFAEMPQSFVLPDATWNPMGMGVGDLNGDGCPDVATANPHGIAMYFGNGCGPKVTRHDLGVSVGATPTTIAVRLDAHGTGDAPTPQIDLALSTMSGTLSLGDLPASCTALQATTKSAQLRCTAPTLAGGTSRTLLVPIQATGFDARSSLTAKATSSSPGEDTNLSNNAALRTIRLPVATLKAPALRQSTLRAPAKLRTQPAR